MCQWQHDLKYGFVQMSLFYSKTYDVSRFEPINEWLLLLHVLVASMKHQFDMTLKIYNLSNVSKGICISISLILLCKPAQFKFCCFLLSRHKKINSVKLEFVFLFRSVEDPQTK